MKRNKGITLVSLIVTIIILIILSTISISAVFSEKGLLQQGRDLKRESENRIKEEENSLNQLINDYENGMQGSSFSDNVE